MDELQKKFKTHCSHENIAAILQEMLSNAFPQTFWILINIYPK